MAQQADVLLSNWLTMRMRPPEHAEEAEVPELCASEHSALPNPTARVSRSLSALVVLEEAQEEERQRLELPVVKAVMAGY